MRTFEEMKAAAASHNARQNPNFLSDLVDELSFEFTAANLSKEFTGGTIGEFEEFALARGYSREEAHQITLAHIRNCQAQA